jgi:hypothetical protein
MTTAIKRSEGIDVIKKTSLSPQEAQIVDAFIRLELSAARVAEELNLDLHTIKRAPVRRMIGLGMLTETREKQKEVRNSVIAALHALTMHDPKDAFDPTTGEMLPIHEMPDSIRMAIKGFKTGKFGLEITFYDRAAILQSLLAYLSKPDPLEEAGEDDKVEYHIFDTEGEEVP